MKRFGIPCLIMVAALWIGGEVMGMRSTTYHSVAAWSQDGEKVLVETSGHGPEGGGTFGYRLVDGRRQTATDFMFSNTMSPGDGSTPEWISLEAAAGIVRELGQVLTREGFADIDVSPVCKSDGGLSQDPERPVPPAFAGDNRHEAVHIGKSQQQSVAQETFQNLGGALVCHGMRLEKKGKQLVLQQDGRKQVLLRNAEDIPLPLKPDQSLMLPVSAHLSPSGKLLVLIVQEAGWHGNEMGPVFFSPTGKIGDFKEIRFTDSQVP